LAHPRLPVGQCSVKRNYSGVRKAGKLFPLLTLEALTFLVTLETPSRRSTLNCSLKVLSQNSSLKSFSLPKVSPLFPSSLEGFQSSLTLALRSLTCFLYLSALAHSLAHSLTQTVLDCTELHYTARLCSVYTDKIDRCYSLFGFALWCNLNFPLVSFA
jgi:hypothetical protein